MMTHQRAHLRLLRAARTIVKVYLIPLTLIFEQKFFHSFFNKLLSVRFASIFQLLLSVFFINCLINSTQAQISHTYTFNADFDEGILINVNHDTVPDQLQLNRKATLYPFINVAASGRGTVVRIDVNTGKIIGEYLSSPLGRGRDPSRTTVDFEGNLWVGNRAEGNSWQMPGYGSVVKIGLVVGGTRCNSNGTPNPNGQYLKPPFQHCTAIDRDGDGLIRTSRGLGDTLAWRNFNGVDDSGYVKTAEDECIILYKRVAVPFVRHVSIDAMNNVWIGARDWMRFVELQGDSGDSIGSFNSLRCGGYGGLIDRNQNLWSTNRLLRHDLNIHQSRCIDSCYYVYGLTVDTANYIWGTIPLGNKHSIVKLYPNGTIVPSFPKQISEMWPRGLAVTPIDNNIWIACSISNTVLRLDENGNTIKVIDLKSAGGYVPTGVAVDINGKVWVTNLSSNNVMRIDPKSGSDNLGEIDLTIDLGKGAYPYNYSDMTGRVAGFFNTPRGTWTVIFDANQTGTQWGTLTWSDSLMGDASTIVEVRADDDRSKLVNKNFLKVLKGIEFCKVTGRFIEIKVTLIRGSNPNNNPILYDLTVQERISFKAPISASGPTSFCRGGSVTLSLPTGYKSYEWSTGEKTQSIFVTESGQYVGTVRTADGCDASDAINVKVNEFPHPKIIADGATLFCDGDSVRLQADTIYNTYRWNTNAVTPYIFAKQSGTYTLTVLDSNGCPGSDRIDITVIPKSKPSISASGPTEFCEGDNVTLTVDGNYISYEWASGEKTKSIVVSNTNNYFVSVVDSNGCKSTASIPVVVHSNPKQMITGPSSVCEKSFTNYSVKTISGNKYLWTIEGGNGTIVSGNGTNSVSIKWNASGDGVIKLRETSAYGCLSDTSFVVTVRKSLAPKISVQGFPIFCEGDSVILDAGTGYTIYQWNNVLGPIVDATNQSIVVKQSGQYSVKVTDANGCSGSSDTISVTVNQKPSPAITGAVTVCENTNSTYNVKSSSNAQYDWTVTGGSIASGNGTNIITVQWGAKGLGIITCKETNSNTGCSDTTTYIVTIKASLNPIITANKTSICEGDSVTLDAGSGYATYQWNTFLGPIMGAMNQSITVKQSDQYFVTVTDANGCTGTSQPIIITVNKKPTPIISGPTSFCEGDSVAIRASSGYLMYQWSNGLIAQSIIIKQAGNYFVTVTDSNGCVGISLQHAVIMNLKPTPPIIGQRGDTLFLTSTFALIYQWFLNGTIIPNATSQELISTQEGFYTVRITDANGCSAFSLPYEYRKATAATTITLPFLEAAPGEKVTIPLMLQSSQNLNSFNAKDFSAEIRLNKNILLPIGSTSSGVIQQQERIIPLAGIRRDSIGSLVNLEFLAVLADVESTTLRIEQFDWSDNRIKVTTQDGEFKMKICREGGARLVRTEGKLFLQQNRPNPYNAATMIEYEIIEKGHTQLYVMNLLGKKLATIVDADLEPGRYEVYFDANALSSGTYVYVLQTPSQALYKLMEVVK